MKANERGSGLKISGDWSIQSRQLKVKFPLLSDVDLKFVPGKEEDLIERLMIKLHMKRHEVIDLLRTVEPFEL
jgi:hypothetical protein